MFWWTMAMHKGAGRLMGVTAASAVRAERSGTHSVTYPYCNHEQI